MTSDEPSWGGRGWGDDREGTGIAFGMLDGREMLGVCRSAHGSKKDVSSRFFLYDVAGGAFEQVVDSQGEWNSTPKWDGNVDATDIAFGLIDNRQVVRLTCKCNDTDHGRFWVYELIDDEPVLFGYGGSDFDREFDATAIAFGELGGEQVLAIVLNGFGWDLSKI